MHEFKNNVQVAYVQCNVHPRQHISFEIDRLIPCHSTDVVPADQLTHARLANVYPVRI